MTAQKTSMTDVVQAHLRTGATVQKIADAEGISSALVEIMVDDLERRGLAASANSLCASGLGACGTGEATDTALLCAGCPLASLRTTS